MPFIKLRALNTDEAKSIAIIFKLQESGALPAKYFEKVINTDSISYYQPIDCLVGDPTKGTKHAVDCHLNSGESLLVLLPITEFEELIRGGR